MHASRGKVGDRTQQRQPVRRNATKANLTAQQRLVDARATPWKKTGETGKVCGRRGVAGGGICIAGLIACSDDRIAIARGQHVAVAAHDTLRRREWRCRNLRDLAANPLQASGAEIGELRGILRIGENDDSRLRDRLPIAIERLPALAPPAQRLDLAAEVQAERRAGMTLS